MEIQVLLPKETEMDAEQPKNKTNTTVYLRFSVTLNKTLDI